MYMDAGLVCVAGKQVYIEGQVCKLGKVCGGQERNVEGDRCVGGLHIDRCVGGFHIDRCVWGGYADRCVRCRRHV